MDGMWKKMHLCSETGQFTQVFTHVLQKYIVILVKYWFKEKGGSERGNTEICDER